MSSDGVAVRCGVCPGEVLPYQAAHVTCSGCGEVLAVCFGCGGSSWRPPVGLEYNCGEQREPGEPAYARLAALRVSHACAPVAP